ncbi:MAG TPA: hypothetical protein VHK88_19520, partial [Aquihabitans sp.]|nr:hypothetical protein [Aquihabitans sp.]
GWQLELSSNLVPQDQAAELQTSARRLVEQAVEVDPDYSYARAFRAVLAFRGEEYALAQRYLAEFRERDPSPDAEAVITQLDLDAQIAAALAEGSGGSGASPTTAPPSTAPPTTTAPG